MTRDSIYLAIDAERDRQSEAWCRPHYWGFGDCSSESVEPTTKLTVLTEELGEVARAVLDNKPDDLVSELVQVAAVAIAWLESLPGPLTESASRP